MEQTYRRGDIFVADLGEGIGSKQQGIRPVVVIQNDIGNLHCPTVIVAPMTSQGFKKVWRVSYRYNGVVYKETFDTEKQARARDAIVKAEKEVGTFSPPSCAD